jgi:hypothetical protein
MKINKLLVTAAALSLAAIAPAIQAAPQKFGAPQIQCGNLDNGAVCTVGAEEGHYFKDGTSGQVNFTCKVIAQDTQARAWIHGGKNFYGNTEGYITLNNPVTFNWTLENYGESNGQVLIKLETGNVAQVQCTENH